MMELEQEFNIKVRLLDYLGILHSIPATWRNMVKINDTDAEEGFTSNLDRICSSAKVNKTVYMELVQKSCLIPTSRWEIWLEELGEDISELDWLDIFPRIQLCTTSTRLRSLGYRFLIRDVLTNTRLFHMGKVDTTLCYLCKKETETISHLYWHCTVTRRLWERLKSLLLEKSEIKVALDPLVLILGATRKDPSEGPPQLISLLSLIVKNYIHSCKCKNTFPIEEGLINRINYIYKIERSIAEKRGMAATLNHHRKWKWME